MLPAAKDLTTFGKEVDTVLMGSAEREKEVLVVMRRSRNADYAEKQGSSYLEVFKMGILQYYDQVFTPCHPSPEVFIFSGVHSSAITRKLWFGECRTQIFLVFSAQFKRKKFKRHRHWYPKCSVQNRHPSPEHSVVILQYPRMGAGSDLEGDQGCAGKRLFLWQER
jgi:hypothetical protein